MTQQQMAMQDDIRILTNQLHVMDSKFDQIFNPLHSESSHQTANASNTSIRSPITLVSSIFISPCP